MTSTTDCNRIDDHELSHWLALSQLSGIGLGSRKIMKLFERFHSARVAWEAASDQLRSVPGFNDELIERFRLKRETVDPGEILRRLRATDVDALAYADPAYPARLRHVHDPPVVLYFRGALSNDYFNHAVGIVGTRKATGYGQRVARDISSSLAQRGITVVSGMALGIDSLAHWGALDAGGRTAAVLGCGPDYCYPSTNRKLYAAILEKGGLIISEHFPGTKPETWMFPARNRIISGLSDALVVVEAGTDSGALITAKTAFEQSREVFAVPGRIDSPASAGTNALIAANVAHLISSADDILREMNWVSGQSRREVQTVVELYGREREVYEMLSGEPAHFDLLAERTGMPAGELSATLTMLELAGVVVRHTGDWYTRYDASIQPSQPSLPESI